MTGGRARPWCQPSTPLWATGGEADAGAAFAALMVSVAASPTPTTSRAAASATTRFLFTMLPLSAVVLSLRSGDGGRSPCARARPAGTTSTGPGCPAGPREPERHAQQDQAHRED